MLYNIYYIYSYYNYIYYFGSFYYGLRVSYDTYNTVSYMYNLIPYNSKKINNDITVELFEIQEKDEWIFLDIYK
mgnify:FL=1